MRGSDPDAAVYYLAAMLEGGEDPRFLARRIVIAASEDVGNADPRALLVAVAAAQAVEHVGLPEAQLNLAQAAIYLARAPKSNASARAIWDARGDVRRDGIAEPPAALRGSGYRGAEARGHGRGVRLTPRRPRRSPRRPPSGGACRDGRTMFRPGTARSRRRTRRVAIGTGDKAPEFDLEEAADKPRVRLSDYIGRSNVLLVFHPFAFTRDLRRGGASTSRRTWSRSGTRTPRSSSSRATHPRRARRGRRSSAPSTRSPPTSGRTARPRSATASSTTRPARRSAGRS